MHAQSHLTLETPWSVACQAALPKEFFQAGILEWGAISSSRGISRTQGLNSCLLCLLAGRFFYHGATWRAPFEDYFCINKLFGYKFYKGNKFQEYVCLSSCDTPYTIRNNNVKYSYILV